MLRSRRLAFLSTSLLLLVPTSAFAQGAKPKNAPAQHQGGDKKPAPQKPKPEAPPAKKPEAQKPAEKPKQETPPVKKAVATPLALTMSGATNDTMPKLVASLQGLQHSTTIGWKCPSCGVAQATKGECTKCKKELVESTSMTKVATDVKGDAAKGTLSISLAPHQSVEVSEIERAARGAQVTLDRKVLAVPAYSKLFIAAPSDSKDAKAAVEKALTDSKLFSATAVHYDTTRKQFVALVEGVVGTPTYGATAAAIEKAGAGYKLDDLAWTAPCEKCLEAGHTAAACKGCWHDSAGVPPHG